MSRKRKTNPRTPGAVGAPRRDRHPSALCSAAALLPAPVFLPGLNRYPTPMLTDIRVQAVRPAYEDFHYRTPIKFGGVAVDRVTLLNVEVDVETRGGKTATGFG